MAEFAGPVCCIDGCDTDVPGLDDGHDLASRDGVVCTDCWDYYNRHVHWPDDRPDHACSECLIDDGHVRHTCDPSPYDAFVAEPGTECQHCGEVVGNG